MKKVAIIGSGVAGLAAGVRLQKLGYEVTIYEKEDTFGGRMNVVEEAGFKFDLGPTIVMMPEIYQDVFTFAGVDPNNYIPMQELDTMYSVFYSDGTKLDVSGHFETLLRELEKVDPKDSEGYFLYMAEMYKRYNVAKDSFILRSFRSPLDFYNPHMMKEALKLKTFSSAYSSISKYVKSEKIRQLLSFQTLYIGLSPFNGPSIYTIIPMIESVYGVWFIQGGMRSMAEGMAKLFEELGGTLKTEATVEKVTANGKHVDSLIINGEKEAVDLVLNTADFPYALKEILPENTKEGKYQKNRVDNLDYSCSCFMLYLGIKGEIPAGTSVHNIVFSSDFAKNIEYIFEGKLIDDPSIYVYLPGIKDESLAPEGHYGLYALMPVPNLQDGATLDWNDTTLQEKLKKQIFAQVASIEGFQDIEASVVLEKMFLPSNFEQKFNAQYGATFGLKPTLLQSNYYRPQPKSKSFDNLYYAGSSIHPGAGVPIVLTSAMLAVEEIKKDEK